MTGDRGRRWQLLVVLAAMFLAVSTSTFYTYGALFDEETFNATIEGEACQNGSKYCPHVGTYDVGYGDVEVGDGTDTPDLIEIGTPTEPDPPGGENTATVPSPDPPSTSTATETELGGQRTDDPDRTEEREGREEERRTTVAEDRQQGNETEQQGTDGPPTGTDGG